MDKKKDWIRFKNEGDKKASIYIYGTIGGYEFDTEQFNTIGTIRKELDSISQIEASEIEVNICSYGGYVDHALAIHDALKDHPAKITTVVNSFCASSATIIAMAGDVRKISKNALYLIHKCSSMAYGNEYDLNQELLSQKTTNEVIFNIYKEHCTKSNDELKELFEFDNGHGKWITAQECVDFGFATEIYNDVANLKKVANADKLLMNKMKMPPLPEHFVEEAKVEEDGAIKKITDSIIKAFSDMFVSEGKKQNKPIKMKKFNDFERLVDAVGTLRDTEFNEEEGANFTADQLNTLNLYITDLTDKFNQQIEAKTAEFDALKEELEQVTNERDEYKEKYENAPAQVTTINSEDNVDTRTEFEKYMDESPIYKQADLYI